MIPRKDVRFSSKDVQWAWYTMLIGLGIFALGALDVLVGVALRMLGMGSFDELISIGFMAAFLGFGAALAGAVWRLIRKRW